MDPYEYFSVEEMKYEDGVHHIRSLHFDTKIEAWPVLNRPAAANEIGQIWWQNDRIMLSHCIIQSQLGKTVSPLCIRTLAFCLGDFKSENSNRGCASPIVPERNLFEMCLGNVPLMKLCSTRVMTVIATVVFLHLKDSVLYREVYICSSCLLSTSLAWPAVAGCSRAETFSQLSSNKFIPNLHNVSGGKKFWPDPCSKAALQSGYIGCNTGNTERN